MSEKHSKTISNKVESRSYSIGAEINAPYAAVGMKENAIYMGISSNYVGILREAHAVLTPEQAIELGDHLKELARIFNEAHPEPTRIEMIESLPAGTVFKTEYSTYVRTRGGVRIISGDAVDNDINIRYRFSNSSVTKDIKVLFSPEA